MLQQLLATAKAAVKHQKFHLDMYAYRLKSPRNHTQLRLVKLSSEIKLPYVETN